MSERIDFTKGHGTENDFVLLEDPEGLLALDAAAAVALADRRAGIGGDGVIRAVRTRSADIDAPVDAPEWFMDYRNADGSIAEMCGNGVRVFAHHLVEKGLVDSSAPILVGTRGGVKSVTVVADPAGGPAPWYRVDMGAWDLPAARTGDVELGADSIVTTRGTDVARPAVSVDMGNPHTVVALPSLHELISADLGTVPDVDPVPPHGTNIEFIVVDADGDDDPRTGRLRMRVHERGVGETMACGTGACAAALAARFWAGHEGPVDWTVDQPGGPVRVEIEPDRVFLSGPAVLVADVSLLDSAGSGGPIDAEDAEALGHGDPLG